MTSVQENFGWIEIVLVATVAFGFGFYQLWSVNREIRRDREAKERGSDTSGHAIGQHELDDR
jgi:hypothetical protein